nr:RRXRR domain-containing protein [uncultured Cupriavidus sp.]
MAVLVLDKHGRPLMPRSEKQARLLLKRGRARIRLVQHPNADGVVQGISHSRCSLVQRADGYGYHFRPKDSPNRGEAGEGRAAHAALSIPGLKSEVSRAA